MVGRKQENISVKNRLGRKNFRTNMPRALGIRDARDVLEKKGSNKARVNKSKRRMMSSRPQQITSKNTKARIQRLMPLNHLINPVSSKLSTKSPNNCRKLSISQNSIQVTTRQPQLSRKTISSSHSLKIITPSNMIAKTDTSSNIPPKRTLTNEICTSRSSRITEEEDLRTSSPNLSFTSLTGERPLLLKRPTKTITDRRDDNVNMRKVVVTNLHSRVIKADIVELFGAVGPLFDVTLANNMAEIVFEKAGDAESAYHKYHNRMLDGKAMKCALAVVIPDKEQTTANTGGIQYTGAELVYPAASSRPVIFQVRI